MIVAMLRRDLKIATTTIGKRIREARVRACMTQEALGVAIGLDEEVASVRVSRYESGVHAPPVNLIRPLADALSVPPAYLVTENNRIAGIILNMQKLNLAQLSQVEDLIDNLLNPDE